MCSFFSFMVGNTGEIYALLGRDRETVLSQGENPDSHSYMSDFFGVDEDQCWKFDLSLDYGRFRELMDCLSQGEAKLSCIKELVENSYDGGLPWDEFPLAFLVKTVNWLIENREKIEQAGRLKFGREALYKTVYDFDKTKDSFYTLLKLFKPLSEEELIEALQLKKTKHPTTWLGDPAREEQTIVYWRRTGNNNILWISISGYKKVRVIYNNGQPEITYEWRLNLHTHTAPVEV